MGKGLEVQPDDVKKAGKDFSRQVDELANFRSNFAANAHLTKDDFGNADSAAKAASNYDEAYNKVLSDLATLSKQLGVFAKSLQTAARDFDEMERHNTITVKKGDTLWAISKKRLGDGARYPEIAKNNPKIKNPDLIFPGEKIKVRPESKLKLPFPAPAPHHKKHK